MSWPQPVAGAIVDRCISAFEQAYSTDPVTGAPLPETADLRNPDCAEWAIAAGTEMAFTELYLYQASLAEELMIDTAQDWLPRHAALWGVPQLQPLPSLGNLILAGPPGLALPAGIEGYGPSGLRWSTNAPAVIPASGAVSVPAAAELAGTASDLAAGTVLPLVSPVAGLDPQSAAVDPGDSGGGFVGGRDLEDVEAWRARIVARVRDRGLAGKVSDYTQWALEGGTATSRVLPLWMGAGTVGVALAMAGPRTPTDAEVARIAAYIEAARPVTAELFYLASPLVPVDVTLAITPDTVANRAAVLLALAGFFQGQGAIGVTVPLSRLSAAVSNSGEYANSIAQPAADVAPGPTGFPVLGNVTFTSAAGLPQAPAS